MKYQLTLTEAQLNVLQNSLEFMARITAGQWMEIFDYLPLKFYDECPYEVIHSLQEQMRKTMPLILKENIDGYSSSFGVGSPHTSPSHDIARDMYATIRHYLSWKRAVESGAVESTDSPRNWNTMMSVNFDTPMHWSDEPLPEIKVSYDPVNQVAQDT